MLDDDLDPEIERWRTRRRRGNGLVWIVIASIVAAGAYALWRFKDDLRPSGAVVAWDAAADPAGVDAAVVPVVQRPLEEGDAILRNSTAKEVIASSPASDSKITCSEDAPTLPT